MRVAPAIVLAPEERRQLEQWSHGRSTEHRLVLRSKIVLRAAAGRTNKAIVEELGTNSITVGRWRSRFAMLRIEGIRQDAPRSGGNSPVSASVVNKIVDTTLHQKPPGETHWSTRTLADHLGVSHMTVHRVWGARHLQPHRKQSFEFSPDPKFEEKLVDVVGLYVHPPERAILFSVGEKPQMQALEQTQTVLPLGRDFPEGRPHEYKRNGTVDLFAALEILTGDVTVEFHHRHRHQEFLSFLSTLDRQAPKGFEVHVIVESLSAHSTEGVRRWLQSHPRFRLHFTPTHASWVNAVEGWFSKLTRKTVRRGSFVSVEALKEAVLEYVKANNHGAQPYVWTKGADEIIRKIRKIKRLSVTGH